MSKVPKDRLEALRMLVRRLASNRHASYADIAFHSGVSVDTLKSFAIGRTRRPRGEFSSKLIESARKLHLFDIRDDVIDRLLEVIFEDEVKIEEHQIPFLFASTSFGVSKADCIDLAERIDRKYDLYRFKGQGEEILRVSVRIGDYSEKTGLQSFRLFYKSELQESVRGLGYVYPIKDYIIFGGKFENGNDVIFLICRFWGENIVGVGSVSNERIGIFSSRFLMVPSVECSIGYGTIDLSDAERLVGAKISAISNKSDKSGILQLWE